MTEKTCTKCGKMQDLGAFSLARRGLFGRKSQCKACHAIYRRNFVAPVTPPSLARLKEEQTFNRFVRRAHDPNTCWEWSGKITSAGYAELSLWKNGTTTVAKAHRVSYRLHVGPIPPGMFVCHTCDNPPCCNPQHLFLGTPRDNTRDMILKGRGRNSDEAARGEANGHAKLTSEQVIEIRQSRLTAAELAQRYGVGESAIRKVRHGLNWRHVT
jgi:hypothetical protein